MEPPFSAVSTVRPYGSRATTYSVTSGGNTLHDEVGIRKARLSRE